MASTQEMLTRSTITEVQATASVVPSQKAGNTLGFPNAFAAYSRLVQDLTIAAHHLGGHAPMPVCWDKGEDGYSYEWNNGRYDCTLDINPDAREGYWHAYNIAEDTFAEEIIKDIGTNGMPEGSARLRHLLLEQFKDA